MTLWQIPPNCNNAPKQQWLVEWLQAWIAGEPPLGSKPIVFTLNGQTGSLTELDLSKLLHEIKVHSVLTHGREGSIRAQVWLNEASGRKKFELMIFAKFTLNRLTEMRELHILYVEAVE